MHRLDEAGYATILLVLQASRSPCATRIKTHLLLKARLVPVKTGYPLSFFVFSIMAFAQTAAPQKTQPAPTKPARTTPAPASTQKPVQQTVTPPTGQAKPVAQPAPGEVIITIGGVCPTGTPTESCKRTVTKDEFEKVVNAVNPGMPTESRRQMAGLYVQLLTMANEAEKLGLDKDPAFEERMRLERLRVLAQATEKRLQEGAKPSDQEVENFYAENSNRFEEYSLRRIVVPKTISGEAKPVETKALADKIRDRATAGEDTDKLEAEVFATVKAPGAPPLTSLGWKRRGGMDPRHEPQILPLKAGQLTGVLEDAQSYYIYKVDSKRIIPLATIKDDIERGLSGQSTENKIRALLGSIRVDMNEAYFGPPPAAAAPAQPPPAVPPKK